MAEKNAWLWIAGIVAVLYLLSPGSPLPQLASVVNVDSGTRMLLTVSLTTHPVDSDVSDGYTTRQFGRWELTDQNKTTIINSFGPRKTDGIFEASIDYTPLENSLLYAEIAEFTDFFNSTTNTTVEVKKEIVAQTTQLILVKKKVVATTLPATTPPVVTAVPSVSVEETPGFFSTYFPYILLTLGVIAIMIALLRRKNG